MSDAFDAGAWVIGEVNDPLSKVHESLINNLHKPIGYKVDNIDAIEVGNFFDIYLEKVLPDSTALYDDTYYAGLDVRMRSNDLLRTIKHEDGSLTARFIGPSNIVDYELDKNMFVISAASKKIHDSAATTLYIHDAFYDKETDTEYYISASAGSSSNKNFVIHEVGPNGYKSYSGTTTNTFFIPFKNGGDSIYVQHDGGNSGKFRKLKDNLFVVTNGSDVYLVRCEGSSASIVTTYALRDAYNNFRSKTEYQVICYVNRDKNKIYIIGGATYRLGSGHYTYFMDILSYDPDNLSLTLISETTLYDATTGSYAPVPIAFNPEIIELDDDNWTIPVMFQTFDSTTPRNNAFFIDVDANSDSVSVSHVPLPDSIHQYELLCPVAPNNSSIMYVYADSNAIFNNSGNVTHWQFNLLHIDKIGTTQTKPIAIHDVNTALRLVVIDNQPMYFIGTPYTASGSSTYKGVGTCRYLLKAVAYKLGVVIEKNAENNTIKVARTGVARTTAIYPKDKVVETRVGCFGQFKDNSLFEINDV